MTDFQPCVWEDCNRGGVIHDTTAPFCAYHHPAGRAHIEAREETIARLQDQLDLVRSDYQTLHDAADRVAAERMLVEDGVDDAGLFAAIDDLDSLLGADKEHLTSHD